MNSTYKISDFEAVIKIGTTFQQNWFRGHSKTYNELTPGIYRNTYNNLFYNSFNPNVEQLFAEEFKRKSPSIASNLPDINNNLEWLFLMQHHGVPTRLLDWTENILVATFFAVNDDSSSDAEIWSMLPWKLNGIHGFWGLPILDKNPLLRFLSNEIFHSNPQQLMEELNLNSIPNSPIAFLPPLRYPRMTAQQSAFTIHPRGEGAKTICETIDNEKYLTRYIIPNHLKQDFMRKLSTLGIDYKTIFPDLGGLSKTIVENGKDLMWSQPDPLELEKIE